MNVSKLLALILATVLFATTVVAQDRDAVRTPLRPTAKELKVFVLQGDGAVNSIRERTATEPVVEVRDERNQPVQGVDVVFQLPQVGPSGSFIGQKLTWTGRTDANGQVVAPGLTPNHLPGRFNIRVIANRGSDVGRAILAQTNSIRPVQNGEPKRPGRSGWWKAVIIAGAGGAVGGVIWATRRNSGPSTVVLQPGTVSFGGPR